MAGLCQGSRLNCLFLDPILFVGGPWLAIAYLVHGRGVTTVGVKPSTAARPLDRTIVMRSRGESPI